MSCKICRSEECPMWDWKYYCEAVVVKRSRFDNQDVALPDGWRLEQTHIHRFYVLYVLVPPCGQIVVGGDVLKRNLDAHRISYSLAGIRTIAVYCSDFADELAQLITQAVDIFYTHLAEKNFEIFRSETCTLKKDSVYLQ